MSLLGTVIGAGAGLVGNVIGASSQNSTNKTNERINRENNQFNAEQAQLNREWNEKMWEKNNAYNSPQAMMARGLNPYMQGSAASAASSPAQVGSAASSSGLPSIQAFKPDFSSVGSIIASFAQARNAMSEASNRDIMQPYLINKTLGDTNWRNLAVGRSGYWSKSTGRYSAMLDQSREFQELKNLEFASRLTQAQETQIRLSSDAQQILNRYMDANQQADLFIKNQTLANLKESGRLTMAQYKTELQKAVLVAAQAKGQKISNKVAADTAESLIYATIHQNRASGLDALWDSKNVNNRKGVDYSTKKIYRDYLKKQNNSYEMRNALDYGIQVFQGVGNRIGSH